LRPRPRAVAAPVLEGPWGAVPDVYRREKECDFLPLSPRAP